MDGNCVHIQAAPGVNIKERDEISQIFLEDYCDDLDSCAHMIYK